EWDSGGSQPPRRLPACPTSRQRLHPYVVYPVPMKRFPAAAVALMLAGCGYVGEPRPPLANVPPRVSDLAVVQRGGQLIVQFSAPALTTEGHPIPRPLKLDLRAGTADQFEPNQWAAGARQIPPGAMANGIAR